MSVPAGTFAEPTVQVLGVTAAPDSPAGTVTFQATSVFGGTVSLYVDRDGDGYDGDLLVSGLPYRPGPQSWTWADLAAYAHERFDPARPLYVYAEVDDGFHAPVLSA